MKQVKNKKVYRPRKDPIKTAAEYGIDIAMLKANLARPIMERIRRHQIALNTYNILRKENLVGPIDEMRDRGDGKLVRVFTVDSLIKAREAMNCPRDKEALLELEAIRKMRNKQGKN